MPYLTLFLIASVPLFVEWAASTVAPTLWRDPRWVVLPALTGTIGWLLPMQVLGELPWMEHGLSAFLGLTFGLLVAVLGQFRATFWSGPSEAEIARTGRRSYYGAGQPGRPRS